MVLRHGTVLSLMSDTASVSQAALPEGWSITHKDGDSKVSLTRDVGDEVVQVDFVAREFVRSYPPTSLSTKHLRVLDPA